MLVSRNPWKCWTKRDLWATRASRAARICWIPRSSWNSRTERYVWSLLMGGEIGSENQGFGQVHHSRQAAHYVWASCVWEISSSLGNASAGTSARSELRSFLKERGSFLIWITNGIPPRVKPVRAMRSFLWRGAERREALCTVLLHVLFLTRFVVSVKHLMHFHLTGLFAYMLT